MNKWILLILILLAIEGNAETSDGGCDKACGSGKCVNASGYEFCSCSLPYYGDKCEKGGAAIAAYLFGGIGLVLLLTTFGMMMMDKLRDSKEEDTTEMEMKGKQNDDKRSLPLPMENSGKGGAAGEKSIYLNLNLPQNLYEEVGVGTGNIASSVVSAPVPSAPANSGMVIEEDCYVDLQNGEPPPNTYEELRQ